MQGSRGQPRISDESVLRNAVEFTTRLRAYLAEAIALRELDQLPASERSFLAVEAFALRMTSLEDVLGWVLALSKWSPHESSLFDALDRVAVDEKKALRIIGPLDAASLRKLLHVPTDQQLTEQEIALDVREAVTRALPQQLAGLKRILAIRSENEREHVIAFNKSKHMLLAFRAERNDELQVLLTSNYRSEQRGRPAEVWLRTDGDSIRRTASEAVALQAVLNSALGVIWLTRYGGAYYTPDWAHRAQDLPGWRAAAD